MIRYKIKNEYELGKPKLREAGNRDDPEAILEGVAMAGLVGLLRQLGDLAEFAAEIFHGLHEEVIGAAARGNGLMVRVQQLEAEFPLTEKGVLCQNYSKVSSNMGVDWHANLKLDHNPITKGDMPRFIMASYEKCHEPPQLFMLDKFDIYGAGTCLKRFSDPSFFKTTLASSGMLQEDTQREKRTRRVMNTGLNSINVQISKTRTLSNFIPNLDKEDFNQVSEEIPVRRVKLKHRQLNRSEADDIRSCMEHLLEMDLLEHKVLLTNHSDSHESATDIRYIVVDAALNMNGNLDTACSPINEGDKLKVKSKDFQDILPEHSIQVSRYLTSSKPDNDNMFSEDENNTEDDSADSPSSEVLSSPSSSRVYHMDYLRDCGNEAVGSNSGYISDDPPTEPDSYMDALTTMDSEVETDTENKGRCLGGFEKPSSNPFITESNATLSNLRSNGSVDTTRESIELNNVSDSSVKILHKNDIYVDDESTCKSKNLVIPSERNDNELCQELAEASDSFSGSLQQVEKKLLQVKHDGQHSQVVEQQVVEYVAGSLHIPEVKQDLTKQEMEAGFIVLPQGITGEINNAIAPLDSLASLKAEVGVKIGYTLSEGKSNDLQHKVEFLPSESSNRQHEEMKGSMHASNHYASISNILEGDLQMETPIKSTVTDIVINESGAENYDPHTVGSPYASVLNDQLQKQSASQEISAVARPNCAPCTLSSSKPSEVPLLDDASHISSLQLEEVDGHPSIGKSIPVETSDSDNNYGRKSIPNSSNWSSEEQMPSTVFFPIKGSNPFDGPIEVQGGDAADALSFQITGEHANHSLLFDKGPFDEQKSYLHKFGDPVSEQLPTDIVESRDSFDSEASPQIPVKIAMEDNPPLQFLPGADLFIKANNFPLSSKSTMISIQDSKHLEPSVWQDENGSSYENMNIHCNLVDIVSEESEKEPRRDMHSVISNSGNKELKVHPLDKVMHGQLVQIGFNPLESYAARCAAPDLHATVRNREIDHVDIPPSNETKFGQDRQKESSVPPKCGVEIYDNSLASKSRKLPIPIFSRPSRINFENTQQSSGPFSSELNFNSQFQGNTALSKNTEVTPPLPPLPPAEWRLLKLQVEPLSSSGKTAQPLCFALPNPFAAFPTLAKNPLQNLQVQEIESANQYVPLLQGETKIPLYVSSSSEKEMAQYLDRQVHVHDESHHHNTLQMEGTMVNPFLISSTEDSNRLYGNEAYGEISIQPPNPFPELGQQSAPSLALSHGESWRALNSSDLTLGFEEAISKLNQINPSLEKERSLDVQLSTMEEEKHKFSTSFPNGDAQITKLSTSFHSKEHKSSDHDNLSSRKESPSTSEDNSAPMLATEKPINKIPTIPKPPKYPLFEVTSHDRSMLRKVPKMVQPANKSMADNRNSMLEQIRNKSFSLKPALSRRPNVMGRPSTNLKVVAILERANAIRQAVASDDDEDSWSDS